MKRSRATSPGKIILFGEHAVVYGRPAIAAPVTQVRAEAVVEDSLSEGIRLSAPDLERDYWFSDAGEDDPFARAVQVLIEAADIKVLPNLNITVVSDIPMASGLGSGAAMASAVIRALAKHLNLSAFMSNEPVSSLTYKVEELLHGTPSGIDNTVVVYEQPVFFIRQQTENHIETLGISGELLFIIADSGIPSKTKEVVADVRRAWLVNRAQFEEYFDSCGRIAQEAKEAINSGDVRYLGQLMTHNHNILTDMGVSSKELDDLVNSAMAAGALGAKMSGGGRGGNMISLVDRFREDEVREALRSAGAVSIIRSLLSEDSRI